MSVESDSATDPPCTGWLEMSRDIHGETRREREIKIHEAQTARYTTIPEGRGGGARGENGYEVRLKKIGREGRKRLHSSIPTSAHAPRPGNQCGLQRGTTSLRVTDGVTAAMTAAMMR
ncbi:hypothetical protein NDU88_000572 [Pleurodeles waltl]|uniref:Uncharacterized protein n=1 Tax=Pleurodeles waltl TaxID=8319 RepID=A0AAV7U7J1_PLEWA|nr:hypothetical protein NDU88_000572 [Pleurodeles waltl]